jgi:glycosyltransferase involved in cell wall biosynthesis
MQVLLTSNASYAPPKGGSTRSNLVWLRHLANSGHTCRIVCPTADTTVPDTDSTDVSGIDIRSIHDLSRRTHILRQEISDFCPDWVLVSSEDLSHVLLREASAVAPGRIVYLAHTPQFYPFGPASWNPDRQATQLVCRARAIVAIAQTTAKYIEEYCGAPADVIHPPIYGNPPWPQFGSFDEGYVLMINPCVVKGIEIFLELARRMPEYTFAGLAGWGTTSKDRAAMSAFPNVRILEAVPNIDAVLQKARVLLMPSLWMEGFGLIAMEAMLRGVPVISSDAGGLVEAKRGTGFVIPVRPIERYEASFDEAHMPRPVQVEQDIEPWESALRTLLGDREVYRQEAERSREVAVAFVSKLRASDFEDLLERITPGIASGPEPPRKAPDLSKLSAEKRALLLQRLRKK